MRSAFCFIAQGYPLGDHRGVTWQNYEALSKYRLVWTKASLETLSLFKHENTLHKHTCPLLWRSNCSFRACVHLLLKILLNLQISSFNFLTLESPICWPQDVLMGLLTFMEMIIWNICGNDNMENLDRLRPFPRLDYDVREGQGAADWPTPANSCYAPRRQNCFLSKHCSLQCEQCTTYIFCLLRVFCD